MAFKNSKQHYFIAFVCILYCSYNIWHIIFFYFSTTHRRNCFSCTGIQQTQVIINFRHAANGATWCTGYNFLLNGNCRAKPFNKINIRLIHTLHKLACISTQAFCITSLPFGKKCIYCKR